MADATKAEKIYVARIKAEHAAAIKRAEERRQRRIRLLEQIGVKTYVQRT